MSSRWLPPPPIAGAAPAALDGLYICTLVLEYDAAKGRSNGMPDPALLDYVSVGLACHYGVLEPKRLVSIQRIA